MRGLEILFGIPKTEDQARVVILRNVDKSELEWLKEHPEDLQKRIDAILGRIDDDEVGRRWVYCKKHGLTNTAMKFGMDDRCNRCVGEMLAEASIGLRMQPLKQMPLGGILFYEYQYGKDRE